jgi:cation transport ATPase
VTGRFSRPTLILLAVLVAIAVLMAFTWGPRATFVFSAFVVVVWLIALAAGLGGSIVESASRGRFRRDDKR